MHARAGGAGAQPDGPLPRRRLSRLPQRRRLSWDYSRAPRCCLLPALAKSHCRRPWQRPQRGPRRQARRMPLLRTSTAAAAAGGKRSETLRRTSSAAAASAPSMLPAALPAATRERERGGAPTYATRGASTTRVSG
eukprot:361630-Chlamydomonas_euryale.AAC.6